MCYFPENCLLSLHGKHQYILLESCCCGLQVGAKHDAVMCFGPSARDGFGCCYNPQDSRLNFTVTAFNICSQTDSDKFANILRQSLMDMHDLLASAHQESKL